MEYMTYQVVMNYRVKVDDKGLMVGKPELINGFIPKHVKKKKNTPQDMHLNTMIDEIEL